VNQHQQSTHNLNSIPTPADTMFSTSSLNDGFFEAFGTHVPLLTPTTANFSQLIAPLMRVFA
jgi:hypothetical protein